VTEPVALSRHEIEARIVRKAWQDEAFRAELIADPVAVFTKYTGVAATQLPTILVHQEQSNEWNIVLPAKPAKTSELSDQDMERVAGGQMTIGQGGGTFMQVVTVTMVMQLPPQTHLTHLAPFNGAATVGGPAITLGAGGAPGSGQW